MINTSEQSTEETVRNLIEEQLNLAAHGYEFGPDDSLWDLGMTSLTCMGLMLNIEDSLGIELPAELLKEATFRSVNSILTAVQSVPSAKRAAPSGNAVAAAS